MKRQLKTDLSKQLINSIDKCRKLNGVELSNKLKLNDFEIYKDYTYKNRIINEDVSFEKNFHIVTECGYLDINIPLEKILLFINIVDDLTILRINHELKETKFKIGVIHYKESRKAKGFYSYKKHSYVGVDGEKWFYLYDHKLKRIAGRKNKKGKNINSIELFNEIETIDFKYLEALDSLINYLKNSEEVFN